MMNEKDQVITDNTNTGVTNTGVTNTNNTNKYLKTHIKNDGRTFFDHHVPKELGVSNLYSVSGFVVFCIVFVIVIPYFILKYDNYAFLAVYLPNLDLIANAISYRGGPLGNNLFRELYMANPVNISSFLQQTIINYFALLSLTYIIARETFVKKSVTQGWSMGFVMILMTYLLPAHLITHIMNKVYGVFSKHGNLHYFDFKGYIPAFIVGSLVTFSIIYAEKHLIELHRVGLDKFAKFIIKYAKSI